MEKCLCHPARGMENLKKDFFLHKKKQPFNIKFFGHFLLNEEGHINKLTLI